MGTGAIGRFVFAVVEDLFQRHDARARGKLLFLSQFSASNKDLFAESH